jgi:hypothetical protein
MTNDRPCGKWFPLLGIGHETENEDCAVYGMYKQNEVGVTILECEASSSSLLYM